MSDQTPSPDNPITRLTKDLKAAALTLSRDEARYLVDTYYQLQQLRIATSHQTRTLVESGEPHSVILWFATNADVLESQVKRALDSYSDASITGRWAKSITGIGPVIAAGLLAHIEIEKAQTAGAIWRFAGLDPTSKWEKGEKRPWNPDLKVLAWKIGESFVKVSGNEHDYYGKLLLERKVIEKARNDSGALREQAALNLTKLKRKDSVTAKANQEGRLSDGHIHSRAKRWAVKLFLSHVHQVMYMEHFHTPAPKPYILTQPTHAHEISVPHWPF
jgi:hypothetical protein